MTAVAPERIGPAQPPALPLLPEEPHRAGPVTRRLLARTAAVLAALQAGAVALLVAGGTTAPVIGSSMIVPGGGLLHTGRPVLFAATAASVVLCIVLWWAMSLAWGIPAVWLLSGIAAVALDDGTRWGWAVGVDFAIAAACTGAAAWSFERRYRTKRAKVGELNEYLRTADVPEPSRPRREPDDQDAELLRWCHELALQPLDEFCGFGGGVILDCDRLWTRLVTATYKVRRLPRVTNDPPLEREVAATREDGGR